MSLFKHKSAAPIYMSAPQARFYILTDGKTFRVKVRRPTEIVCGQTLRETSVIWDEIFLSGLEDGMGGLSNAWRVYRQKPPAKDFDTYEAAEAEIRRLYGTTAHIEPREWRPA